MNYLKPLVSFSFKLSDSSRRLKCRLFQRLLVCVVLALSAAVSQPVMLCAQPATSSGDSASKADVQPEEKADEKRVVDHLIYIPYDRLNEVIDRLKSKVVISYEEYLDLVKRAGKRPVEMKPAAQAVISSSKYTAVVNGDVVEITAEYQCRAIQDHWAEFSLNLGQAAVGEISSSGKNKVLLRGTGDGKYSLLFESAGDYQVTLKLLVRIKRSPAGPRVDLTVPPISITTLNITIPKADQKITVSPRHIDIKNAQPVPQGSSAATVSLGAVEKISLTWSPETGDRPEMDLLSTVTNQIRISIRDGLIHTDAKLNYKILRGELNSLRVAVPLDQRILDVTSSSRLQGWTVNKEEKRQVIEVKLLGKVNENFTLEIHTERSLPTGPVSLGGVSPAGDYHGIHALDVTRENGTLSVTHGKELTLVVDRQTGLVRTDVENNERSFRYFSPAFDFVVRAEPVKAILDLKHDAFVVFREQRIEVVSQMQYTIRRTGVFSLAMQLPEGFSLTGVDCPMMAEFQHDKKKQTLSVVLKEQFQGQLTVNVRGYITRPKEDLAAKSSGLPNLPLMTPEGIRQEEGRIAVFTIEAIELVADEDKIESAQAIPVNTIAMRFPETAIRAAWKFQSRPVLIPVRTIRRPTRLTAQTATTTRVEPSGAIVETIVSYHVQYAGIDRFYMAVPEAVSNRIQIEVAGPGNVPIQQKSPVSSNDAPADDDKEKAADDLQDSARWVVWMIKTQRPVTGSQKFKVIYDVPFSQTEIDSENVVDEDSTQEKSEQDDDDADDDSGKNKESSQQILLIQPRGSNQGTISGPELSRSTGEAVVHVDPALSLAVNATGQGVEAIDIRELKLLAQRGQQAFRYPFQSSTDPVQLTLNISRHEIESVVSTVVSRALTEYVIGASEKLAVRSRMRIKTSQRQRLLIQLPENVQPMLVLLNGENRELQKGEEKAEPGWKNFFVNVSRPGNSDQEFQLTLQYLQPVSPLTKIALRGGLALNTPRLQTSEGLSVVVQQSRAVLWLPEQYVPVTVELPYQRVNRDAVASFASGIRADNQQLGELNSWIGSENSAGLNFPTDGNAYLFEAIGEGNQLVLTYWSRTTITASLTFALMLIGLILMRTTWENKFLAVIVVGTLLSAALQFEPEMVKQGVASSRLGGLALLVIWGIHGFFQCTGCCKSSSQQKISFPPLSSLETSESELTEPEFDHPEVNENVIDSDIEAERPDDDSSQNSV